MSQAGDLLREKCMNFSIRIVNLYKWLCDEKHEYVMSKQLLRAGTSIGANLSESQNAITKADFTSKIYISSKESNETQYWLELLFRTEFLDQKQYDSIMADATEIGKLLTSVTKKIHPQN